MNHSKNYFWGIIFILIGIGALFNNVFHVRFFTIGQLWPVILILIGLSFEIGYFTSGRSAGVLVPGGILTTIGVLFLFENLTRWHFSGYTWPIYPLAVAIGLFQLYLFDGRRPGLLIPVVILTAVSIISFASMLFGGIFRWINTGLIFPVLLIIAGISILFRNYRRW